ncbi:MAG: hypothetical protein IT173_05660 [Acidobacteria bacterium]|nr:hypothetical protein [Acidobacteriota bacterium]
MSLLSIICGALLVLVGLAGYIHGTSTGHGSVTALIPAFIGIPLALLGVAAGIKDGWRKHLMHVAVVIALLGFIATAGRLISKLSELSMSPAVLSQTATAAICLVFIILSIRSFAAARRDRI